MPHRSRPIPRRAALATALGAAAASATPRPASAQDRGDWPSQPVRMILPYAAGGPTDVIARLLCDTLSQRLPQRIVVENRTGAGGNIGASVVAKSRPDGTTFLFSNTGHAVNRALEFSYGSTGTGGALQLVSLLFTKAAGLRMEEVPYRGSAPAAQDLIAGRVEMLYDAGVTAFPLAQSGQVRALAVSSARRSAVMPDVPTIGEAGYPDATFSVWQGVLAPTGTPAPILEKLRSEIAAVLNEGSLRSRLTELGAERIVANTPAEAKAYVEAEMARWERVLREAGVRPQ